MAERHLNPESALDRAVLDVIEPANSTAIIAAGSLVSQQAGHSESCDGPRTESSAGNGRTETESSGRSYSR